MGWWLQYFRVQRRKSVPSHPLGRWSMVVPWFPFFNRDVWKDNESYNPSY